MFLVGFPGSFLASKEPFSQTLASGSSSSPPPLPPFSPPPPSSPLPFPPLSRLLPPLSLSRPSPASPSPILNSSPISYLPVLPLPILPLLGHLPEPPVRTTSFVGGSVLYQFFWWGNGIVRMTLQEWWNKSWRPWPGEEERGEIKKLRWRTERCVKVYMRTGEIWGDLQGQHAIHGLVKIFWRGSSARAESAIKRQRGRQEALVIIVQEQTPENWGRTKRQTFSWPKRETVSMGLFVGVRWCPSLQAFLCSLFSVLVDSLVRATWRNYCHQSQPFSKSRRSSSCDQAGAFLSMQEMVNYDDKINVGGHDILQPERRRDLEWGESHILIRDIYDRKKAWERACPDWTWSTQAWTRRTWARSTWAPQPGRRWWQWCLRWWSLSERRQRHNAAVDSSKEVQCFWIFLHVFWWWSSWRPWSISSEETRRLGTPTSLWRDEISGVPLSHRSRYETLGSLKKKFDGVTAGFMHLLGFTHILRPERLTPVWYWGCCK